MNDPAFFNQFCFGIIIVAMLATGLLFGLGKFVKRLLP